MKYCVKCGHELAEGAKFCPACGNPVRTTTDNVESENVEAMKVTDEAKATELGDARETEQTTNADSDTTRNNEGAQPQLGFVGSVQYILQHVFEFNANVPESRKSVFWWGTLGVLILDMVLVYIPVVGTILCWVADLLLVSAVMRRLKYINQNPGLAWLFLVPVLFLYPMFLMLLDRKEG